MELVFTKPFIKAYNSLPQRIRRLTDKQLELLLSNPQYPSLQIKKMEDSRDIWEGRITKNYRFTFCIQGATYILRKVGTHDILKTP